MKLYLILIICLIIFILLPVNILIFLLLVDMCFPKAARLIINTTLRGTPRRILSCNVRGMPVVNGWGYKDKLRTFLNEQKTFYDTIVLQEVFMTSVRKTIQSVLEPEFNIVYLPSLVSGNGLMIASRYYIKDVDSLRFGPCSGTDCFAQKGALGAQIGNLFLVTTHLQDATWDASSNVRKNQMENIRRMCQDRKSVMVVGDFNTHPESPLIKKSLGMDVVYCGYPTHESGEELDYAAVRGVYKWSCFLLHDTPPADHRGIVLEREV